MSDYETGYGRPPKAHQFQSGRSGNPKGRPKGLKNEDTLLWDLLSEKVRIQDSQGKRSVQIIEVIALQLRKRALEGDVPAQKSYRALTQVPPVYVSLPMPHISVSFGNPESSEHPLTESEWRLKEGARIDAGLPEPQLDVDEVEIWEKHNGLQPSTHCPLQNS